MKNGVRSIFTPILFSLTSLTGYAATEITSKSPDGSVQKILVEKQKIRIDSSANEYLLYFSQEDKMYVVSSADKEILEFTQNDTRQKSGTENMIRIEYKHMGNGPKYAGYPTQKYIVMANGLKCETSFVSRKALSDSGLGPLLNALHKSSTIGNMMKNATNICDQAQDQITSIYSKIGLPLYTLQEYDQKHFEIVKIQKGVSVPSGTFDLPKGYKKTTLSEKMKQAMPPQGTPDMPPEVREMMRKLQQQGGQ